MSQELDNQELVYVCGKCKKSLKDDLRKGNYYCWNCYYDLKDQYIVKDYDSIDYELAECADCNSIMVKHEKDDYWNRNQLTSDSNFIDYCEKCTKLQVKKAQEKSRLERIEKLKQNAIRRLSDVFPNEYNIRLVEKFELNYYRPKSTYNKYDKIKEYKFPCGKVYPIAHWTLESVAKEHNCRVCKVILNKSKANVLTQDEVATLFAHGIDGKRSGTGNVESEDGVLMHYRTIESIRTKQGYIIDNSQCWSSGFASCPSRVRDDEIKSVSLPLSTLQSMDGWSTLLNINIIQTDKQGQVLFMFNNKPYLFGVDEYQRFLVELPDIAKSIEDAYFMLNPINNIEFCTGMYDGLKLDKNNFKRQGDWIFIPLPDYKPDVEVKQYYRQSCSTSLNSDDEKVQAYFRKLTDSDFDRKYGVSSFDIDRIISENEINISDIHKLIKEQKPTRQLVKFQLNMTNHEATHIALSKHLIVKGKINHTNRQHSHLELGDVWHLAVHNNAVRSFNVNGRSGRGD